jgi:hypothetical protein
MSGSQNQSRGELLKVDGRHFASTGYGMAAIALLITLCTVCFLQALMVGASYAYHVGGYQARRAQLEGYVYIICAGLFALVSVLLVYKRKRLDDGSASFLRIVSSATLVFAGIALEVVLYIVFGYVQHMWKR